MEELHHDKETAGSVAENNGNGLRESEARIGSIALKSEEQAGTAEPNSAERAKANSFLRRHGRELAIFSRASKLTFAPSANAKTFAFYPKKFRVETPLSWFASEVYSEEELSFANHHEIAHFIDMQNNSKTYLDNFERLEEKAESLARDYLTKHPGEASLEAVKKFYYEEIHGLYNVLDDIYVNNLVFQRNKFFNVGDGRKAVESLYEKLGFKEADLTKEPLHRQMIDSLLRDEMLGEVHGKSIVDERVNAVLEKRKLGKTIREIVNKDLKPRQGFLIDPEKRYRTIRTLIEPEYLKLLEVALEEERDGPDQDGDDEDQITKVNPVNTGGGGNNPRTGEHPQGPKSKDRGGNEQDGEDEQDGGGGGDDEFNPFKNKGRKPTDILDHGKDSDKTIKSILESFDEADKIKKMSEEERNKYLDEKRKREYDEEHHIDKSERREHDRIMSKIKNAREEMGKFWDGLIGKSIGYRQVKIRNQRRGRLNVDSYIDKLPEIEEGRRRGNLPALEIYERNGLERVVIDQPEEIAVTLLVDCSASMDSRKVDVAKQAVALFMYSIKDFNRKLASEATQSVVRTKLWAGTEVIVYGSDFETIKGFNKQRQTNDVHDAEIIKSISKVDNSRGTTDDASPLGKILAGLTIKERNRIKQGKLKKIVFEITDGEPDNPLLTTARLAALADAGVLVVGFQIGEVGEDARETFQTIWNGAQKKENKHGVFIGEKIEELPDRLMATLAELLNNITI